MFSQWGLFSDQFTKIVQNHTKMRLVCSTSSSMSSLQPLLVLYVLSLLLVNANVNVVI